MTKKALLADLERLQSELTLVEWARRNDEADVRVATIRRILRRMKAGDSELAAVRAELPEEPVSTWCHRLTRFRNFGRSGLIDRRRPKERPPKFVTPEVQGFVRGLLAARPGMRAPDVTIELASGLGVHLKPSTTRKLLLDLGVSHPVGRPAAATRPEPLPLAGAELLKAVDLHVGAMAALTQDVKTALAELLPPSADELVRDDRADRDSDGRFLPSYNTPEPRRSPDLGERFNAVVIQSVGKDLPAMRTANSSTEVLFRKIQSLVLLPIVTDAPRWSALQHWQGDHLKGLVGYAYQPATLDKFARELKYARVSTDVRASVAAFWIGADASVADPAAAAAVLYGDARVKPLWTHAYARSTAVTVLGKRVMPAITTVHLHSGCGTPVIYREFSGGASVPKEIVGMLDEYEAAAGPATARRLVVLDSESHAVWLFKELHATGRVFLVPVRSAATGANARFEGVSEWAPFRDDEICSGSLWLNDSRPGAPPLRVRVVARRRHRTQSVAWYATNATTEEFGDARLLDLYFARWPLQELVFRDGNGRVGLGVHHGYGKLEVDNVAVLDETERIEGRLRKLETEATDLVARSRSTAQRLEEDRASLTMVTTQVARLAPAVDQDAHLGRVDALARGRRDALEALRSSASATQERSTKLRSTLESHRVALGTLGKKSAELTDRKAHISAHQTIFTVDTELDEIMTAFKLTFMCLCTRLIRDYLSSRMEIDTLIRSVLTLPGERVRSRGVETIRIFRQTRDTRMMPLVEEACKRLTALKLRRDKRLIRFELVDRTCA